MDPYRPVHYAPYRPYAPQSGPTYAPASRPGYLPTVQPTRPNYLGQRPGYGPLPIGGAQGIVASGSEVEKLTTLFIGGISPGVTDDWMERILKTQGKVITIEARFGKGNFLRKWAIRGCTDLNRRMLNYLFADSLRKLPYKNQTRITFSTCGSLKSWKRVKDQSGNPKGFGFAEYLDADSVLRALRVLGGEGPGDDKKDKGVALPALEEGAVGKKLIVKADENTRKYLDQYEASRPRTVHDTELDKNALISVITVIQNMTKPQESRMPHDNRSGIRKSPNSEHIDHMEKDDDTDLPADLPPEQKDLIYREIAMEQAKERSHRRDSRERQQYGHYHQPVNFVPARESRRESYALDDEDEEQKRQAKRKTEMEMAFKERERRWQHREETMATNRERELEREIDAREKQIRDRELMARKLAEWDDDVEAERGQEEYYRDRNRWWFHRQQYRAREMAMDEQDKLREQQEIESELRQQEWERTLEEEKKQRAEITEAESHEEKELTPFTTNGSSQSSTNIKAKLTLNISSKRRAALMTKRRVLVPLEYSDDEDDEKRTEDRKRRIKDLVETIPTDKEGLWKWNVKWEELDENILNNKLQSFVSKKIVGYLGVQEDELVSFVMDHLRNHKSAEQLTKEMEMVF
ncbi:5538_t:CDS:10 [Dentiscutata erythropus]|uniref:5538_t:CDS:1 n=1 Tax=Dentiscutata erythropus TaxID=1348616 RepID=A0A9N9AYQ7_9GLOM|nr:5538_t:CDS:10 [Dentiscutata erythropus]